ncbi:MAG: NrfD/PsrC family molybdoenzyme membrane anchor subunit [Beijerinckiaceae bacterium]
MTLVERPSRPQITYYGLPALKPNVWDWKVPAYMFVAGAAGSAQILSALAGLAGGKHASGVVRNGRYIGFAGAVAGAPLLVGDLHTPDRFYNMLRIYRSTSPLSIGSYILTSFGALSGAALAGQALADRGHGAVPRAIARVAHFGAAVAGAGMATYTAPLLSATSTPVWAAAPRLLAVAFACSSMASGAAALSLAQRSRGGDRRAADSLEGIMFVSLAAGLAAHLAMLDAQRRQGVGEALQRDPGLALKHKAGSLLLGHVVPLVALVAGRATRRTDPALSRVAAGAALAGAWFTRSAMVGAGVRSAEDSRESLRFARRGDRQLIGGRYGGARHAAS